MSPALTRPPSSRSHGFKRPSWTPSHQYSMSPQTQYCQTSLQNFPTLRLEEWNTNPSHHQVIKLSLTSPLVHLSPSLLVSSGQHLQNPLSFLSFSHCHCPSWEVPHYLLSGDFSIPRPPSCSCNQFSNPSDHQPHKPFGKLWNTSNSNCYLFQYLVFMAITAEKYISQYWFWWKEGITGYTH